MRISGVMRPTTMQHNTAHTIQLNGKTVTINTAIVSDPEHGDWLGIAATHAGETLETGAWIADATDAQRHNEEAGIAAGLRQGVAYPNTTRPGDLVMEDGDEDVTDPDAAVRFADAVYGPRKNADDGWGEMGMLDLSGIRAEIVAVLNA